MHWGKLPSCFLAFEVVTGCQMKTKKRANASQVANGEEEDSRHVENLLLG